MKTGLSRLCGGNHLTDSTDKKVHLSNMLWNAEVMMRHFINHGHPLHLTLSPAISTCSYCWIWIVLEERVRLMYAQLCLTIMQVLCKSWHHLTSLKQSLVAMGNQQSSRCWYTGSCSCEPACRQLRPLGHFPIWTEAGMESSSNLSDWVALFRTTLLTPSMGRG